MTKATLIYRNKYIDESGNTIEIVIWRLPKKTTDRPHGIKYRCYYGDASSGKCFIRYDNESGKGDHKHIGGTEESYEFKNTQKLMKDFMDDVYDLLDEAEE